MHISTPMPDVLDAMTEHATTHHPDRSAMACTNMTHGQLTPWDADAVAQVNDRREAAPYCGQPGCSPTTGCSNAYA
jgi:hypothetical protein